METNYNIKKKGRKENIAVSMEWRMRTIWSSSSCSSGGGGEVNIEEALQKS